MMEGRRLIHLQPHFIPTGARNLSRLNGPVNHTVNAGPILLLYRQIVIILKRLLPVLSLRVQRHQLHPGSQGVISLHQITFIPHGILLQPERAGNTVILLLPLDNKRIYFVLPPVPFGIVKTPFGSPRKPEPALKLLPHLLIMNPALMLCLLARPKILQLRVLLASSQTCLNRGIQHPAHRLNVGSKTGPLHLLLGSLGRSPLVQWQLSRHNSNNLSLNLFRNPHDGRNPPPPAPWYRTRLHVRPCRAPSAPARTIPGSTTPCAAPEDDCTETPHTGSPHHPRTEPRPGNNREPREPRRHAPGKTSPWRKNYPPPYLPENQKPVSPYSSSIATPSYTLPLP